MQHSKVQISVFEVESGSVLLLQTNKERGSFWQNITGSDVTNTRISK